MHIFASASEHLDAQDNIFTSCLPFISMIQWNYPGLFCSLDGWLPTAIKPRITAISVASPAHKVYEEYDWPGSLKTPDHLSEVISPRAPQGYPNFWTGQEKSGHHNLFWLGFACTADPSSFPHGQTTVLLEEEGNCILPPNSLYRSPGTGCSSRCILPCIQRGTGSAPSSPNARIHPPAPKAGSQPLSTAHAAAPADSSCLEETTHTSWQTHTFLGVLGINCRSAQQLNTSLMAISFIKKTT